MFLWRVIHRSLRQLFSDKHTRGLVTWQSFPWPLDMFGGRASEADQHLAVCVSTVGRKGGNKGSLDSHFWRASLTKTALKVFFFCLFVFVYIRRRFVHSEQKQVSTKQTLTESNSARRFVFDFVTTLDLLRDPATAWQQLWRDLKTLPVITKHIFERRTKTILKCVSKCWCMSK